MPSIGRTEQATGRILLGNIRTVFMCAAAFPDCDAVEVGRFPAFSSAYGSYKKLCFESGNVTGRIRST
jgi:hypothetical protein